MAGAYNISVVLYDGINTVTSSFVATYDTMPTCVGVVGTAGVISSGLIK